MHYIITFLRSGVGNPPVWVFLLMIGALLAMLFVFVIALMWIQKKMGW